VGAEYKVYRNNVQIGVTETDWQWTDIRDGYGFGNTIALNTGARIAMGSVGIYNTVFPSQIRTGIGNYIVDIFE
jgi:hypothetical protein